MNRTLHGASNGAWDMRLSSLWFLLPAAVLSLALMPDDMTLIPISLLSLARAITLVVGLLGLVLIGHLDRWSSSRLWLAFLVIISVAVVTFASFSWQIIEQDTLPPPYAILYLVLARALPISLMAATFLPTKKLFLGSAACAFVAGVTFALIITPMGHAYAIQKSAAAEAKNEADAAAAQAKLQSQLAELARVPVDAGPEPLLPFLDDSWPSEVHDQAIARLSQISDVAEKLSRLMDGNHRLDALHALNFEYDRKFDVPDHIVQRSWLVAAAIARDMNAQMQTGTVPGKDVAELCGIFSVLSNKSKSVRPILEGNQTELLALRDWVRSPQAQQVNWCGEPGEMDRILAGQ